MATERPAEGTVFELELLGGGFERRYRRSAAGSRGACLGHAGRLRFRRGASGGRAPRLDRRRVPGAPHRRRVRVDAARARRGARPLDLIALASRFPLDEIVHVELCARMAMELGGGTEILPRPGDLVLDAAIDRCDRLLRAADLVAALLLRRRGALDPAAARDLEGRAAPAAARGARAHRQGRGRARRVRLALSRLGGAGATADDREHLRVAAEETIDQVRLLWDDLRKRPQAPAAIHALGWMQTDAYLELAAASLENEVIAPLRARGIMVRGRSSGSS